MYYSQYGKKLEPLMQLISDIEPSNMNNEKLSLIKKAKRIAIEEKRWDAYLITIDKLLYYSIQAYTKYDANKSASYCNEFLRFLKNHADEAFAQSNDYEYHQILITVSMGYVIDAYLQFPQIGDEQLDALLNTCLDTVDKYGHEFTYWKKRLEVELFNRSQDTALKSMEKFKKLITPVRCYICESYCIQNTYLLLGQPEKAIAMRDDFIAKRIPKDYEIDLTRCPNSTIYEQNRMLLESAVKYGNFDFFNCYAEETYSSIPYSESSYRIDLVISAYLGHFDKMDKEISLLREFENTKSMPYDKMFEALCIWSYLNGLKRFEIKTIALCWEKPLFEGADSDECSVDSAIVYFEALVDDIGDKFNKSRKAFDYQELKQTFYSLSQGK